MLTSSEKIFLCAVTDLELNAGRPFDLEDGRRVALFRTETDLIALENVCPHAGGTLDNGIVEENILMCVWHGWRFDLGNGNCLQMPQAGLKRFPLLVEDSRVYILPGIIGMKSPSASS